MKSPATENTADPSNNDQSIIVCTEIYCTREINEIKYNEMSVMQCRI